MLSGLRLHIRFLQIYCSYFEYGIWKPVFFHHSSVEMDCTEIYIRFGTCLISSTSLNSWVCVMCVHQYKSVVCTHISTVYALLRIGEPIHFIFQINFEFNTINNNISYYIRCIHPFYFIFTLSPKQAMCTMLCVCVWVSAAAATDAAAAPFDAHIFVYNFCYIKHVTWNTQCHTIQLL